MGRVKQTLVRKTAAKLVELKGEEFTTDFDHNKKPLRNTMPSKKMRNKIAGQISRLVKQKQEK